MDQSVTSGKLTTKRIDTMTEAELDAELRAWGVDPEQMIQNAFQKVCVLARTQAKEIERLKQNRFAADSGKTHWEGCWRDHYRCAMAKIEELTNQQMKRAPREASEPQ